MKISNKAKKKKLNLRRIEKKMGEGLGTSAEDRKCCKQELLYIGHLSLKAKKEMRKPKIIWYRTVQGDMKAPTECLSQAG